MKKLKLASLIALPFVAIAVLSTSGFIHNHNTEHVETAFADGDTHDHSKMTAWSSNNSLPSSEGSYYLTTDVSLSGTWSVPSGTVDLCLNGYGIRRAGNLVIRIDSGSTLNLYDCGTATHKFTVGSPRDNGAGLATVNDSATSDYKTFTGGYITAGTGSNGAALCIYGTFNMYGGNIIGNNCASGDGNGTIRMYSPGTFNMYGGSISYNFARSGGALFVEIGCTFNMYDGLISYNNTSIRAGAIFTRGTANICGGEITQNFGGESTIAPWGNVISVTGGIIHDNIVGAAGLTVANDFRMGGNPQIYGNKRPDGSEWNVIVNNGATMKIVQAFDDSLKEHKIPIYMVSGSGVFTTGWSTYMEGKDPADYFDSVASNYIVMLSDGEAMLLDSNTVASINNGSSTSYYTDFNSALSAWTDGSTLKLIKDVTISSTIEISNAETKTLDLNGHGIKKTGTGRVVTVINKATFNIMDSNPQIEHKFTVNNGLATVNDDLESDYQTFSGGYLTGGNALGGDEKGWGGCLIASMGGIKATVNMSGGTMIGNHCQMAGGAIRIGGDFNGNGDSIFNMTGGAIMYNTAGQGGGVTSEDDGLTIKISGGYIQNNYVGSDVANLCLSNGHKILIESPFSDSTSIGVKLASGMGTFTNGWSTYMEDENPEDYFTSDAGYYVYAKDDEAVISNVLPHVHSWTYQADKNEITATCEEDDCPLPNQILTINANDKVYDGEAVTATLSPSDNWTEENGLVIPEIVYSGNTNVGTYTASIIIGEVTASVIFNIIPATSTDIEVVGEDMTINGIDDELDAIIDQNPTTNSVSLAVKLEEKTEDTATSGDEIAEATEDIVLSYFDITLELTLDSETTELRETTNILEIGIPYSKVNKRGLAVYSYHDGEIRTFIQSDTKEDGTFRVDKENSIVYIYTTTFSTYAIGYAPYYRVSLNLSFGIFDGKINVSLENKNGETVYKLENVDANNVVFEDVKMGQYKAIVSWVDGEINTSLVFNLKVGPTGAIITPIQNN